ncbi:stage II sporulation protein R [Paenibacillus segetis]|uniref:Stage II sporulation protein R n=1 Tax=Paenibacillus segetis TaxID=1325360 RepID=A0ABQ1YQ09_9BACL|nr:stage II sporulation protein R [Paenibacillus segetis]GGH32659.1 stage II sporulation protein R [Paenibacillus segetis]
MRKKVALIIFSFMILVMCWEAQKIDTAVAEGIIPQDSIRLRILANSDEVSDQVVKRRVRDAVVEQMNGWVSELENPQDLEEARRIIRTHLQSIKEQVNDTLESSGKNYSYNVELGVVPFPTKMYGGAVYPAGNYEALRVTLGEGLGKNWWCVLFPPLCFVDAGSGDAVAKDGAAVKNAVDDKAPSASSVEPKDTEVRFFIWDKLVEFWDWISGLFA